MSQLKLSDLIDTPVPLSPEDAVALTLGVADALSERQLRTLPPDKQILLSSTGHLSFESVNKTDDKDSDSGQVTAQVAALTRRLLQLDSAGSADRRKHVPATLLGALERALGQMEGAVSTPAEFRQALERFSKPDPTTLAAVFWRAARLCPPARTPLTAVPMLKVESALMPRADDRRQNLPPPSELRRYLRETERELFEARTSPERREVARPEPVRVFTADQIRIPQPAIPIQAPKRPFYNSRLWRVGSGIAATLVGAVLGTFMAFFLAGSFDRSPENVAATDTPSASAVAKAPAAPADQVAHARGGSAVPAPAERPLRTERMVQPMLLAAAVGADVFSPSFAPRGRTILFHAGREAAPLMRASIGDTGEVEVDRIETLLDDGAANYHVTMSPDGGQIAYDSDRDGVRGVYVAQADGSNPRRISGAGYAAVPSWAPDGKRVAFVRAEPGYARVWNIWFAELPEGRLERVTSHTLGQPWGASWFPDGRQLAYGVEDRIMVADLRSGLARGYRSPLAGRLVRTPAVSPDGREIVFQVQRDGVWLLDVERARMRRILADDTAEEFVWAPDGGAIAYHARKAGSYGLWRLAVHPPGN